MEKEIKILEEIKKDYNAMWGARKYVQAINEKCKELEWI